MQLLFDHKLLRQRLQRPSFKGGSNPFFDAIVDELPLRLAPVKRNFATALNLFPPGPQIEAALGSVEKIGAPQTLPFKEVDEIETLPLDPGSFDFIFSCLGLQYANDLPGLLMQIRQTLKPGGLFMGCLIGGDSLNELREAFALAEMEIFNGVTPRLHPSIDIRQMGTLMQRAKFVEPIVDVEKFDLSYASPLALLKDLRAWTAGNLLLERSRNFMSRSLLARVNKIYSEKFSAANGRVAAHFDLLWFSGWA